MKKRNPHSTIFLIVCVYFSLGVFWKLSTGDNLKTQVFRKTEMKSDSNPWGKLFLFTGNDVNSCGIENLGTGIPEIQSGQEIQSPHRHSEEAILLIIDGSGTWNVNKEKSPATNEDLLYAETWDMYGIKNTRTETLKYYLSNGKARAWLRRKIRNGPHVISNSHKI